MRIGPFQVQEEIARGGMGVVYRALWVERQLVVALKTLLAPSQDRIQRFVREGRALSQLDHPNVVKVHGVGVDGGVPWIAMQLLEGESLQDRLDRAGAWEPAAAAKLVVELADAIDYCHQQGILHRDLKPDNVILVGLRVVLVDFGLVKDLGRVGQTEALSQTGALLGTPGYCSPEHLRGAPGGVGPASDVYGLGAILYALVTREAPVRGATFLEIAAETEFGQRTPTGTALDPICLRCLEKDPADRFESAAALAAALRGDWALAASRRRLSSGLAGVALLIVLGLGAWAVRSASEPELTGTGPRPTAPTPPLPLQEPTRRAPPHARGTPVSDEARRKARVLYQRGNARLKEGDRAGAFEDYLAAIKLNPRFLEAYYNCAVIRRKRGDHEGAIADNTAAIELSPDLASAYYNRGCSHLALFDFERAEADITRAIEIGPADSGQYNSRGLARYRLGRFEEALSDCEASLTLRPESFNTLYNRSRVKFSLKDYEGVIADCTRVIEEGDSRTSPQAYWSRGQARAAIGDRDAAMRDFGMTLEKAPAFANAYRDRGALLRLAGKHRLAARDLRKFSELAPERVESLGFDLEAYLAEHD